MIMREKLKPTTMENKRLKQTNIFDLPECDVCHANYPKLHTKNFEYTTYDFKNDEEYEVEDKILLCDECLEKEGKYK